MHRSHTESRVRVRFGRNSRTTVVRQSYDGKLVARLCRSIDASKRETFLLTFAFVYRRFIGHKSTNYARAPHPKSLFLLRLQIIVERPQGLAEAPEEQVLLDQLVHILNVRHFSLRSPFEMFAVPTD